MRFFFDSVHFILGALDGSVPSLVTDAHCECDLSGLFRRTRIPKSSGQLGDPCSLLPWVFYFMI